LLDYPDLLLMLLMESEEAMVTDKLSLMDNFEEKAIL
jgi:hypothetical protein